MSQRPKGGIERFGEIFANLINSHNKLQRRVADLERQINAIKNRKGAREDKPSEASATKRDLITHFLERGDLSDKEIAQKLNTSVGYVRNVKSNLK